MSLKGILEIRRTLALRLTLWYAVVFTASSLVAFFVFYVVISNVIQRRTDQELLNDLSEFITILELKGIDAAKTEMDIEAGSDGVGKIFLRLLDPSGREIAASDMSFWKGVGPGRVALRRLIDGESHVFETLALTERPYRARIVYGTVAPEKILQIGVYLEEDARFLAAFREVFMPTMVTIVLFSAFIGWFMARRALSGVGQVTQAAVDISGGAFERRVQVRAKGDEIDKLAQAFNRMLDRIHALVTGMREMTDNIAHDLRSPITRIRGMAEVTLTSGQSLDEYQALAANTIDECDRLLEVINTTLDISEAEAGAGKLKRDRLDLARVLRDACDLFQPVAEDKGIRIISEVPDDCSISGDIRKLQRMVANLLDNALKYTPAQGVVRVSLRGEGERVSLSIRDNGIGISPEDLSHIFERFYRCDQSRSEPGAGLGLSLALAIARAHGGDLRVMSTPGEGSVFTIHLPRSPFSS